MLISKEKRYGDLDCIIYEFSCAGEEIPTHSHAEKDTHITLVLKGSVEVYSAEWTLNVESGGIIDFSAFQPHAIRSLEPGTKIINVKKHMQS